MAAKPIRSAVVVDGIAYLSLTKGQVAKFDPEDIPLVCQRNWQADASHYGHYAASAMRIGNNKRIRLYMHKVILGVGGEAEVDHINGDKLDNRKSNLRKCTAAQNRTNVPRLKNNKSGVKGVYWASNCRKWRAKISVANKSVMLGTYSSKEEAARVYRAALSKAHGEFARFD